MSASPRITELNYTQLTIDLTSAQTDVQYLLPGVFNTLAVVNLSGQAGIRINSKNRDLLDMNIYRVINIPMDRIFVTNTAQTNCTLVLSFGKETGSFVVADPDVTKFTYATGIIAAGNTSVWTPATGKRFRLLGFVLTIAAGTTAAAATDVQLVDAGAGVNICDIQICGAAMAALAAPVVLASVVLPGKGYLSKGVNNPMNISLGAALATGGVSVVVFGTEE